MYISNWTIVLLMSASLHKISGINNDSNIYTRLCVYAACLLCISCQGYAPRWLCLLHGLRIHRSAWADSEMVAIPKCQVPNFMWNISLQYLWVDVSVLVIHSPMNVLLLEELQLSGLEVLLTAQTETMRSYWSILNPSIMEFIVHAAMEL